MNVDGKLQFLFLGSFQSTKIYYIMTHWERVETEMCEVPPRVPQNYCLTTIMLYSMLFDCKIGLDEQHHREQPSVPTFPLD